MLPFLLLAMALLAAAQSCENYGFLNGSSCACPVGFGNSTCSQPACGGTIFQGSQRPLASVSSASFANLTASSCSCQTGWTGLGCNVCETANACQVAYSAVVNSTSQISSLLPNGPNNTVICNTSPKVYSSSQMSCQVVVRAFRSLVRSDWANIFVESYFASHLSSWLHIEYHSHLATVSGPIAQRNEFWKRWISICTAVLCWS